MCCLLAEPLDLGIRGRTVKGTLSSWLSVDPEVRIPNLAIRLVEGLRKRHQEHGMAISIGCTSADPNAPTRRFWDSLAQRRPDDIRFFGPIRFWTRVFDSPAVAAAGVTTFEQIVPCFAGLIPAPWIHRRNAPGIRAYGTADLSRCFDWVRAQAEAADLHILWSLPRLDLQLGHPYARTLVLDGAGEAGGFLNYYAIDWSGARAVRGAMIDLFAGTMGLRSQMALLIAAESQLLSVGIQ